MSSGYGLRGSTILASFILRRYGRVYTENTSVAWLIPRYPTQKHCINNIYLMPNKTQPMRSQAGLCLNPRYATGSIPLYLPVITCSQQFTGVHLRTSQKSAPILFNSCEHFRRVPIISANSPIISKHFRISPKSCPK